MPPKELYAVVLLDTEAEIAAVLPMSKEEWDKVSEYAATDGTDGKFYWNTKQKMSHQDGDKTMHIVMYAEVPKAGLSQEQEVIFHA